MSNPTDSPVTGPIETVTRGPRQQSLVALGAAVVGSVLAIVGFYVSITTALNAGGSGPGLSLVIGFVGLVLDLIAVVLAIVALVRGSAKVVPFVAIVVAVLPILWFVILGVGARF